MGFNTGAPPGGLPLSVLRAAPLNLADPQWGLALDGVTDDAAAFTAAIGAGSKELYLPDGKQLLFKSTLAIPQDSTLTVGRGAALFCDVTSGGHGITLGAASKIRGTGGGATATASYLGPTIRTSPGANIDYLVTNTDHTGAQQFAYLEDMFIIATGAGLTISQALVGWIGLGTNSYIRGCYMSGNSIPKNILQIGAASTISEGQQSYCDNSWGGSAQDCVVIDSTAHALSSLWLCRNAWGSWGGAAGGFAALRLVGGNATGVTVRDSDIENSLAVGAASYFIYSDGCLGLVVDNVTGYIPNPANYVGIYWTNTSQNQAGHVTNFTTGSSNITLISDQADFNGPFTITGFRVSEYRQCGQGVTNSIVFRDPIQAGQGVAVRVLNVTGLTSAQIDAHFSPNPPPVGSIVIDTTNHIYLQRETTNWYKSAALTLIA